MVFGINHYVSRNPATNVDAILNQAKLEDNQDVQAKIQTFESAFYIPEFLSEVKEQKLMYN